MKIKLLLIIAFVLVPSAAAQTLAVQDGPTREEGNFDSFGDLVSWHPTGTLLAGLHTSELVVFQNGTWNNVSISQPNFSPNTLAYSPTGAFLAVGGDNGATDNFTVYSVFGTTHTEISSTGTGEKFVLELCWMTDNHLAVGVGTLGIGTEIWLYDVDAGGATLMDQLDPGLDAAFPWELACAPNGIDLAIGSRITATGSVKNLRFAERDGDTLANALGPLPIYVGNNTITVFPRLTTVNDLAWSSDGTLLTVAAQYHLQSSGLHPHDVGENTKTFFSYDMRNGPALAKIIPGPAQPPTGEITGLAWNNDGKSLAVASDQDPYFAVYWRQGADLVLARDPTTQPWAQPTSVAWRPNDDFIALGLLEAGSDGAAPPTTPYTAPDQNSSAFIVYEAQGFSGEIDFGFDTAPANPLVQLRDWLGDAFGTTEEAAGLLLAFIFTFLAASKISKFTTSRIIITSTIIAVLIGFVIVGMVEQWQAIIVGLAGAALLKMRPERTEPLEGEPA